MVDNIETTIKEVELDGCLYMFDTLEELADMLKDDDYECILTIRKKGKLKKKGIIL